MHILLENSVWMGWNVALAFLGVFFGFLFIYFKNKYLRALFFILWVLFVPNTIYLITDIQHISEQFFDLTQANQIILIMQYVIIFILGIISYFWGLHPLKKIFQEAKLKDKILRNLIAILVNFFIAFAVVLGKLQRINSWELFSDPVRVIENSLTILTPFHLEIIFMFGVLFNVIYFIWQTISKYYDRKH